MDNKKVIQVLSTITNRLGLAARMGSQYGGDRDIYEALGYPTTITEDDYHAKYARQDIAKAIIDRPVNATWRGEVSVTETDDDNETPLEKDWKAIENKLGLKAKLIRLDRLTGLGEYGVLLLGFSDVKKSEDWQKPTSQGRKKLVYVKPFSQRSAKINDGDYVTDPQNERYGLPEYYRITVTEAGSKQSREIKVHHTRVLHVVDDCLESDVKGMPRLQSVYNRLMDIEKLVGGDAEMFWRGARPGYAGKTDKDFQMTETEMDALQDQFDEFEHNLRRILVADGVEMKALAQQIADPKNHVDVQIQMISAVTGIPKRILTGSERGELSSAQDREEWSAYVMMRREEYIEPRIIRPLIEKLITEGVLAKAKEEYMISWEELFSVSDSEKAETGGKMAEALAKYTNSPGAEAIMPPDSFLRHVLKFSDEEIELINEESKAYLIEPTDDIQSD